MIEAGNINSADREYPADEWRITGELIRQIATATTWQRIVEAGDALMTVSRVAQSMRDERDHHAKVEAARNVVEDQTCIAMHRWVGTGQSRCPECSLPSALSGPHRG